MSFPRYPKYKASGVEWLGEVPEGWDVCAIKRLIQKVESGTSVNASDEPAVNGKIGVLKTSCVYTGIFDPEENKTVVDEETDRVSCPLKVGTLIVSRMNTPDLIGAAGLVTQSRDNLFLPDRLWQVSFLNTDPSYVYYWTLTSLYRGQVKAVCTGTSSSMKNLGQDQFGNFSFASPPYSEQTAIATFLDRETAKIDDLVAEQKRLMELLKEKRQAVISHAVTKGLNPKAKMKPSGVEWLGDVPEHWSVWKLTHAFGKIGSGTTPKTDNREYYDEGTHPWVNTGDLNDGDLIDCEKKITDKALTDHTTLRIYPAGSVIIAMYGATIGKLAVLQFPASVNQACCVFSGQLKIEYKFLFFWLLGYRPQIISLASGGGQPNVNQDILRGLRVACPELPEQTAIVTFLETETAKFDTLTAEAQRAIDILQERRTALISAAVTGQIDVRKINNSQGV